ncbi:LysR family transcriptional regulator [Luteibacter pinisoli]|uniref:LysR family transcriptional regulator n=1 Tax=Luteibacter pinisoli TaxID=2589080 RepID=A0A4Y5Z5T3_9GAMM|nr:LysR family transcriptional regulator [Luteibacter pinisoli]QDE39755.1 LysR family transcriptional regulator [Luteibacter pinisoli]
MDRFASLQVFDAVMDTGSFSAAARRLDLGQPAVSKIIAQLEERLQVRLFLRNTHGLVPTDAARAFHEHARLALSHLGEAEQAARGEQAALTGRLRVTVPVTFSRMRIIPRLPQFLAAHPGLHVEMIQDDHPLDLLREGMDLALRIGTLDDSEMTARVLARTERVPVASRAYIDAHGAPATLADLSRHAVITYAHGGLSREWTASRGGRTEEVVVDGPLHVTAAEGLRAAVLAGIGISVTSRWVVEAELGSGDVVALLPDWSFGDISLWAVYPAGRLPGAKARAFAAFVEALMHPDDTHPLNAPAGPAGHVAGQG